MVKEKELPLSVEQVIRQRLDELEVRRSFWALIQKILLIAAVASLAFTFVFGIGVVDGEGMYPRMRDGDLVVFYRLENQRNIGDIVAYTEDGERQYGRIVARGGDIVDMNDDGQLIINGNIQEEEVFFATAKDNRATQFPCTVEQDSIFVLGDNRTTARDSRDYGAISISRVDGKVISILRRRGL